MLGPGKSRAVPLHSVELVRLRHLKVEMQLSSQTVYETSDLSGPNLGIQGDGVRLEARLQSSSEWEQGNKYVPLVFDDRRSTESSVKAQRDGIVIDIFVE